MAYDKINWQARTGSGLNRFQDQNGNILELTAVPTEVLTPGTPVSADNMNHMEAGIEEAHEIAEGKAAPVTITVNANASPALGTVANNNEYRCTNASISAAPTMTIAALASTSTEFCTAVIYKSPGTTAPVITNNSGYTAKWQGLDVSSGTFFPKAATVYRLSILFDGIYLNIYVSGVA